MGSFLQPVSLYRQLSRALSIPSAVCRPSSSLSRALTCSSTDGAVCRPSSSLSRALTCSSTDGAVCRPLSRALCSSSIDGPVCRPLSRALCCSSIPAPDGAVRRPSKQQRELRVQTLREKLQNDPHVLRVAIDCSLGLHYSMNEKELKSLVKQIIGSYSGVLRCPRPCRLHLVGLEPGGVIEEALQEHFPGYGSEKIVMEFSSQPVYEEFPRKELVYLSAYSSTVLQEVNSDQVYVVGGVVDKFSRVKGLTEKVAARTGIPTVCLPIKEYVHPPPKGSTVDLPLDQVVNMLLSVHSDGDWSNAFLKHLPKRKQ